MGIKKEFGQCIIGKVMTTGQRVGHHIVLSRQPLGEIGNAAFEHEQCHLPSQSRVGELVVICGEVGAFNPT
jgi:hypothetical protein